MKDYCVIFHILFFSLFSVGLSQLEFDTAFDELTGKYNVMEGDSISLTCTPSHAGAFNVGIFQVSYNIRYRPQVREYQWEETDGVFTVNVQSITVNDSTVYICRYFYKRCPSRCWLYRETFRVSLYVIPPTPEERSCSLVNDTNGIFFINDSFTLRCNGGIFNNLEISFLYGSSDSEFENGLINVDDNGTDSTLWTIPQLSEVFENASVVCEDDDSSNVPDENFCRDIRPVSVFAGFEVTVSQKELQVPNRGNATLTCTSDLLYLASSSEWNYLDGEVTFGNMSMTVDPEGIHLTLIDIDYTNSTSGRFTVSCNVTVGSRNASKTVTISQERIDTTASPSTTGSRGSSETSLVDNTTSVVAISVSIVVLVICAAVVLAIVWYRRSSSRGPDATSKVGGTGGRMEKRDVADIRSDPCTLDDHHYEQTNARLGYSNPDAVVVDNVAYVSYDTGST